MTDQQEETHAGLDPSHGGLTTHRGRREDCSGPDCGPVEQQPHPASGDDLVTMTALGRGLRWLYGTRQPGDALIQHHGVTLTARERWYAFVPDKGVGHPVVHVNVRNPEWATRDGYQVPANPLAEDELPALVAALESLGARVLDTWNGHPGTSGSVALVVPAHRSLRAAVDRYRDGCPEHPRAGVFCECGWYLQGYKRMRLPVPVHHGRCHWLRWPDDQPPKPDGCRWCGERSFTHQLRDVPSVGLHTWVPPTGAQVKARDAAWHRVREATRRMRAPQTSQPGPPAEHGAESVVPSPRSPLETS